MRGEEKGINKAARPFIWLGGGWGREGEACSLPALQGNQFKVIRGDSHHHTQKLGRLSRITQTPVEPESRLEKGDDCAVKVTSHSYF